MELTRVLQSQGFGSRKECQRLVHDGRVTVRGAPCDDPRVDFDVADLEFTVDDEAWRYRERVVIALHKPLGFEVSHRPAHHASVFELLPQPLVARGVEAVGRLDEDTTGLLLLTDDGALLHALTSPKRHVPKAYIAETTADLDDAQVARCLEGVMLKNDPAPARALAAERLGPRRLALTIDEGRYHQVRRMVAAVGNSVAALTRVSVGGLELGASLAPKQWRYVEEAELAERLIR